MRSVGIKELKAHLSEYVRLVRAGDRVLLTDRGRVVAELRGVAGAAPPADDRAAALERLSAQGSVTLPSAAAHGWKWTIAGPRLPAGDVAQLIDEMRGERVP